MLSKLATVRSVFDRVPIKIWKQYVGRHNKEDTACGSSSKVMLTAYGRLDEGPQIVVVW